MKKDNLVYTFVRNSNYETALAVEFMAGSEKEPDGEVIIVGMAGEADTAVVPEKIDGHDVTVIDSKTFVGFDKLKKVVLPRTIERVAGDAFPNGVIVDFDGKESDVKEFYNRLKKRQSDLILEQLNGFATVLHRTDELVKIIKKSKDKNAAVANLVDKFKLTASKAKTILETNLSDLPTMKIAAVKEKIKELEEQKK